MLKIRLMRIGAKKRPFYRVVVVDERAKRTGGYIESLGTYNPLTTPKDIKLKQDRIDYWIKQGAQMSTGYLRIIGKAPQRRPRNLKIHLEIPHRQGRFKVTNQKARIRIRWILRVLMKDLLNFIVTNLVTKPESVSIDEKIEEGNVNLNLTVDPSDMGLIIGKSGQTIRAIRKLLTVRAIAENVRG